MEEQLSPHSLLSKLQVPLPWKEHNIRPHITEVSCGKQSSSMDSTALPTISEEMAPASVDSSPIHTIPHWFYYMRIWCHLAALGSIPGNLLTIVAFIRYDYLQTGTNYLICHQSIADLLTSIAFQIFTFFTYYPAGIEYASYHRATCLSMLWITAFSGSLALANMVLINLERLAAVAFPFRYLQTRKKPLVLTAIITCWFLLLLLHSLPLVRQNAWRPAVRCQIVTIHGKLHSVTVLVVMSSSCLVIALINIIVCKALLRTRMQQQVRLGARGLKDVVAHSKTVHIKNLKITKMIMIVVIVNFICVMPMVFVHYFMVYPPKSWVANGMPFCVIVFSEFTKGLFTLNSIFNPFIYVTRNEAFKKAFRKLLTLNSNTIFPSTITTQ